MARYKHDITRKFKVEKVDHEFKWITENLKAARRKYGKDSKIIQFTEEKSKTA